MFLLYAFQSFGKAHFRSDFRFQSFAVCKSMEQFVVETGNGVAVGIKLIELYSVTARRIPDAAISA